jgi:hypothetical protein
MEGIFYLTDDQNKAVAVQIDLQKYGQWWENVVDTLLVETRKEEESVSWEDAIKTLDLDAEI